MRKLCIIVTGLFCTLLFTTCKQYSADIENDLSYWSAIVTARDVTCDKPSQINTSGAMCIPSATDAAFTLKVRNPKNFTLVTPTSSADAGRVIRFPHLSPQPVYGTDYTLRQTASDTLTLVYKNAFLKKHEWNTDNIGPEITFISTDGRVFSERFNTNIEVNTPPKLSYATIGKTANPIGGKHYYVIILKAEDMSETAGTASELLHKDIKTLSVTGRESGNVAFTSGDTAFSVNSVPIANRRLLADIEVAQLASGEGPTPPSDWTTLNSGPWALRYRTDTEVRTAATVYTFRLADEKGLISDEVSVSTSQTQAQDVQLFDGTNEISVGADSSTPPSGMHTKNADSPADTSVTVKAKTATVGAIITGKVEKYNGSGWEQVGALVNSGSYNEVNIDLSAPAPNAELAYKITLTAGGIGFSSGNEKVFYVKVTKNTTITIDVTDNSTWNGKVSAWDALKDAVENSSGAAAIKIRGEINAPNGPDKHINVKRAVTIEGSNNNNDKLNGKDRTYVFHVWFNGDLKLKKLTLQNGNSLAISGVGGGGAIYCGGGKLKADDVIIQDCKAKNGGGIYLNGSSGMTLTNCQIINNNVTNGNGGGITFGTGGSYDASEYTITGGKISGNTVTMTDGVLTYSGAGLAIANVNIKLTLDSCEISSNTINGNSTKTPRGAGIWLGNKATCTIKGSAQIKDNKLHETGNPNSFIGTGGGIQFDGGRLTLESGTIISGNCAKNGGGIWGGSGCTVTLQNNARVIGNKAGTEGGGVYAQGATVDITNCTLTGNEAALKGGAICAVKADSTASTVTISGGTIGGTGTNDANKATGSNCEGGGIYAGENCTVTLQNNVRVIGNKATGSDGRGGGIYAEKATVKMTNCTFESNTATKGGGGVYASSATVKMTNCTLSGNKADNNSNDGTSGGIYTYRGSLTMTGCTLTGNTARLDGGGVRAESTPVTMTNCTFTGNKARCGGAICASSADVTIKGGTIGGMGSGEANEVTDGPQSSGGGIHIERGGTVTLKGSVQVIGNKAPGSAEGAGVYVYYDSTLQMQESAQVHTNNDVFLQEYSGTAAKIKVTGALTPPDGIAARITPTNYAATVKVLDGSAVGSEHLKFSVTRGGTPPKNWYVGNDGKLTDDPAAIFNTITEAQIKAFEQNMKGDTVSQYNNLKNRLIFYKTNIGNYGVMLITNTPPIGADAYNLKFKYKTYSTTMPNAETTVGGTHSFDLDTGTQSTSAAPIDNTRDFFLQNSEDIVPKNNATFYVLP